MPRIDEPRRVVYRPSRPMPPGWVEVRSRSGKLKCVYDVVRDGLWFKDNEGEEFISLRELRSQRVDVHSSYAADTQ